MTWTNLGSLAFAWWNTSLSPPTNAAVNARSVADREYVAQKITQLHKDIGFAVMGLCEVSSEDLLFIENALRDSKLSLFDATGTDGKFILDTAFLYDRDRLDVVDHESYVDRYGPDSLKAGTMVSFIEKQTGLPLQVIASHWPSRGTAAEHAVRRAKLGGYLGSKTREMKARPGFEYIVLMGDYNDEPFSESLASHVMGTRDRELAKRDSAFFYNPFWRNLGESTFHLDESENDVGVCGTHFYHGGEYSKWFTFDQMLFSPAFLRDESQMVLDEKKILVHATSDLKEKILSRKSIFDHLPVISAIKLRAKQ